MTTAVQTVQEQAPQTVNLGVTAGFSTAEGFALLQRMAKMFSGSSLVPETFRGEQNFGNCVIALNMAQRLGADPLMVMQNLYIVHGNPGWSSKFLIAMFNQCGRYTSIKYRETGTPGEDSQGIIAYTTEKSTGEIIEGPEVTIAIAKAEGWFGKNGSKWKTMPSQMLRTTAPELSMGLQTKDEIIDVTPEPVREEIAAHANTEVFQPQVDVAPEILQVEPQQPKVEAPVEEPKRGAARNLF